MGVTAAYVLSTDIPSIPVRSLPTMLGKLWLSLPLQELPTFKHALLMGIVVEEV